MRIDPETKRKQAERIRLDFTKRISTFGFNRLRTTYWGRERSDIIQKIHFHLFSFDTSFRVHLAVHVKEGEDNWSLNGFHSFDGWFTKETGLFRKPRKYIFHFNRMDDSAEQCASELFAFCQDVAEPWFKYYENIDRLLNDVASPLDEDAKLALRKRLTTSK